MYYEYDKSGTDLFYFIYLYFMLSFFYILQSLYLLYVFIAIHNLFYFHSVMYFKGWPLFELLGNDWMVKSGCYFPEWSRTECEFA